MKEYDSVQTMIELIVGTKDIDDENLTDTPRRVVKSWCEIYSGYQDDPKKILGRSFPGDG